MKKYITKIFQVIFLLAMSNATSYAMDEIESSFLGSNSKNMKCELIDTTCEKCIFTDWMYPLGTTIFNRKSFVEQEYLRKEIIQNSFKIAGKIFGVKEDQEKIAHYICQIVNDENPIKESPLLAREDENSPNHQLAMEVSKIFYKIVTGQLCLINDNVMDSKILNFISAPELFSSKRKKRPRKNSI